MLRLLKSYLTARQQQQCLINGCLSSQSNLLCGVPSLRSWQDSNKSTRARNPASYAGYGVPKGSILGPLLFLIYINDLPNCLKFTTPCLYADDTQIFNSSFNISVLSNNINSDLKSLSDWLTVK